MRKFIILLAFVALTATISAQTNIYSVSSGELIFSWSEVDQQIEEEMINVNSKLRFTLWFHVGQYLNFDFTNSLGLYTGMALRNVGFITEDSDYGLEKRVHRSYNLGVPLALKLGSFKDHFYIYGGGEYELLFHHKEKYWVDGQKHKTSQWFSDKTNRFVPSAFVGVQFPKGLNLQFKYYLDDFLNHDYKRGSADFSDYKKTQLFYVSLSVRLRTDQFKKIFTEEFYQGTMASR
ncbi:hypothetical protein E9993_06900 [Labilibacter sediminis]|nr:hypothetical protein E9993_06900 [Labilibacter sediminis]